MTIYLATAQGVIYETLNAFSKQHPCLGRVVSIPAALGDVALQFLKSPIGVIECLALAAICLFASAYHKKQELGTALINAGAALVMIIQLPISFFASLVKLFLQVLGGLIDPVNMETCNPYRYKPNGILEKY